MTWDRAFEIAYRLWTRQMEYPAKEGVICTEADLIAAVARMRKAGCKPMIEPLHNQVGSALMGA